MQLELSTEMSYALLALAGLAGLVIGYIRGGRKNTSRQIEQAEELGLLFEKNERLQKSVESHIDAAARATTELELLRTQRQEAGELADRLRLETSRLHMELFEAQKARALAEQQATAVQQEAKHWEDVKKEVAQVASEATLKSSSKLIEDHKRETRAAREESEKKIDQTTKALTDQFQNVVQSVTVLDSEVRQTEKLMDVIQRSLSAPASAGHAAETVLENVLKNFGLTEGLDYSLQHTVADEGARLRPDAVLFLPGDTLLVVDAKASKYLLDLANAGEGDENDLEAVRIQLKKTMNKHLKDLSTKDYRSAVARHYRNKIGAREARQITTFMFLPNDGAVEKLLSIDPLFNQKASQSDIILGGPSGLWASVAVAKMRIDLGRQVENQQEIIHKMEDMFQSLATVLDYAKRLGAGLTTASRAYDKLAKSVNGRLVPRANKLLRLGIAAPSKGLNEIPRLVTREDFIDAESDTLADVDDLPLLVGNNMEPRD